ncbi:hypothetical protein L227DRAFT_608189 [Lentinus tigrinus ALCF2SS1-6]|uniref:Uncharacterized protein n=1 Tax=Lentinus tigrinus ALCF2SS1-6 TaxID=1328759 RepID=A0A5C2SJ40_9APHY|nr:hypothetical protein L227DRAFT_608189 [Lentinus tigrinus ALCF2SS1-6]
MARLWFRFRFRQQLETRKQTERERPHPQKSTHDCAYSLPVAEIDWLSSCPYRPPRRASIPTTSTGREVTLG